MPTNWDAIFDEIYTVKTKRDIKFREATSYQLESDLVTYASDETLPAKVLWRQDATTFSRGVWFEKDQVSLVIWFRDLTDTKTATSAQITEWVGKFKGAVKEAGDYKSRFIVDGQTLQVREVFPQERPDGKVHALRVILVAAE